VSFVLCLIASSSFVVAKDIPNQDGRQTYNNNCSVCHGGDGLGGEHGPAIAWRIAKLQDKQLEELIRQGRPGRGMPAFPSIAGERVEDLVAFLHSIESQKPPSYSTRKVLTTTGITLEGSVLSESVQDLALRTNDERIHLLRPDHGRYREVTSQEDWTSYNGSLNGNRYSALNRIQKSNVARLVPRWLFSISDAPYLEGTRL